MTTPSWLKGPPKRILLATDLSARCDRALDRAASLVVAWQSRLVVLHVLEEIAPDMSDATGPLPSWRRPPDPVSVTRRQLLADIGPLAEKASVVIEQGDPGEAILRTAETEGCELIMTGIARDELLGRFHLGSTVDRLLRRSRVPILVVKDRARRPYRHIVVATDFSESSRHALEAAARFFPQQKLTVFHAYDVPGPITDSASHRSAYRKVVEQQCAAFLQGMTKPGRWQPPHVLIEAGAPDDLLRDYARHEEVDLVVLGTHGRGALFEVFLGSVAKQIMDVLPCDALVVREPRAAVAP